MKRKAIGKKTVKKPSYKSGQDKSMYYNGTPVRGMDMPIKIKVDKSKSKLGK